MKFWVDQSLGGLSKWLRFLGFEVEQIKISPAGRSSLPPPGGDGVIVTRQAAVRQKSLRPDLVIVASDHPEAQLAEICRRLNLPPGTWEPLKRCSRCNETLSALSSEEVEGRVPDYISQKHHHFFECPRCHKVFWEGSHQRRIRRRLQELENHLDNT